MFRALLERHSRTLLLYQSIEDIKKMLTIEEEMFEAASVRFVHGTEAPNVNVHKRDEEINAGERMVRRAVLQHLTLNPKQDLPGSLVLVSIVIYVERIGDYIKDLWDLRQMPNGASDERLTPRLDEIRRKIGPMFAWCVKAVCEDHVESGNKVMESKRRVEALCDALLTQLLTDTELETAAGITTALGARCMRRISAHLSNIASSVVAPLDQIGFDGLNRRDD